ncbi:MAG: glycosyltransferase involved in cell wall biosynthesis [Psychroserpens sp.]|jgi:glycosyltransferase involved in cell wall biosynthesis
MPQKKLASLIYIHDFPIAVSEGCAFYSVGLPESYFDRFLTVTDEVELITRKRGLDTLKNKDSYSKSKNNFVKLSSLCQHSYLLMFATIFKERKRIRESFIVLNFPSILALFILIIIRPRFYSIEHANDDNIFNNKRLGFFLHKVILSIKSRVFRNSLGVLAVSEYLENKDYPPIKEFASNVNLVPQSFYKRSPDFGKLIFLTVGAVTYKKGIDLALKFFENYKYDFEYHVLGEIIDIDINETVTKNPKLASKVTLHGVCDSELVAHMFKNCNIYIQPSRAEGLPRATLEAMAFSLPCITSMHPCFSNIVPLIQRVDWNRDMEVEKAIEILKEKDVYNDACKHSYELSQKFTPEVLKPKRKNYYERVIDELPNS